MDFWVMDGKLVLMKKTKLNEELTRGGGSGTGTPAPGSHWWKRVLDLTFPNSNIREFEDNVEFDMAKGDTVVDIHFGKLDDDKEKDDEEDANETREKRDWKRQLVNLTQEAKVENIYVHFINQTDQPDKDNTFPVHIIIFNEEFEELFFLNSGKVIPIKGSKKPISELIKEIMKLFDNNVKPKPTN